MTRAELPKGERRLLAIIEQCDFTGKGCCPTQKELTFLAGFKNHRYTNRLVKNLERKGCLRIEKRRSAGCKWFHNVYHVTHWNPHVRRGICNLRREWPRVRAEQEAAEAESGSERTAKASKGSCPGGTPSLRASKALPARSREARIEIRRSSMEQRRRHLQAADLTEQPLLEEIARKDEIIRKYAISETKNGEEIAGLHNALRAAGKEITKLKRDITRQANESARAEQIEKVVEHWRYHRPKASSAFGKPGSRSYQVIEKALGLMADDEKGAVVACCEAIDGLHLAPWQEYDQRFAKPGGPKRVLRNQLEHALGDEQRIERCRAILRRARGGGAQRAWRVYMALGETERAWADEVMDLLREQPAPRERFFEIDGIRVREDGR